MIVCNTLRKATGECAKYQMRYKNVDGNGLKTRHNVATKEILILYPKHTRITLFSPSQLP